VTLLPGMLEHDRKQAGWSIGQAGVAALAAPAKRKEAGESPAPFAPPWRRVYLHCMQGSPFTMIGPQTGASASPSWGGLYWRCRASFGPPIEPHAVP
jgi:hypothetical protein